jgi:large repetitive protein
VVRVCGILAAVFAAAVLVGGASAATPLNVATTKLPAAEVDAKYDVTLGATGGAKPYRWSLAGGTLPRALKLYADGSIVGYPQNAGHWSFKVRVTDAHGKTDTQSLTIVVGESTATIEIWTSALHLDFVLGSPLSTWKVPLKMRALGGTAPFSWTMAGGPPGISIDASTGLVDGTPTVAGTYDTTFRVTDGKGRTASKTYTARVVANPKVVGSAPDARVGTAYSAQVTVEGGLAPFTWSVSGGNLPPGLAFAGGTLSGTPTTAGTYDVEIQAVDKLGQTARTWFRITVAP